MQDSNDSNICPECGQDLRFSIVGDCCECMDFDDSFFKPYEEKLQDVQDLYTYMRTMRLIEPEIQSIISRGEESTKHIKNAVYRYQLQKAQDQSLTWFTTQELREHAILRIAQYSETPRHAETVENEFPEGSAEYLQVEKSNARSVEAFHSMYGGVLNEIIARDIFSTKKILANITK